MILLTANGSATGVEQTMQIEVRPKYRFEIRAEAILLAAPIDSVSIVHRVTSRQSLAAAGSCLCRSCRRNRRPNGHSAARKILECVCRSLDVLAFAGTDGQ